MLSLSTKILTLNNKKALELCGPIKLQMHSSVTLATFQVLNSHMGLYLGFILTIIQKDKNDVDSINYDSESSEFP